ncbi:MAG: hypothetical protein AAFY36_14560 [Bacteroidota bacterium]
MKKQVPFDLEWLIKLFQEHYPEEEKIAENLKECTEGWWKTKAYIHFIPSIRPNLLGSEWQFKKSLVLEDKEEGTIIIDILTQSRIGGIEFVDYIKH